MSETNSGATAAAAPPTPPRWKGVKSLDLVHQLNERCIEVLCELAADARPTVLPIVTENRELWSRLEPEARRWVARMPFVLVDAKFSDDVWWKNATECRANGNGSEESEDGLPRAAREQLMHETIMFAWQTARWERTVAQLSLGMTQSVAEIIAAFTPQQVREIAVRECRIIKVRWAYDPAFWRDLLLAAIARSDDKLAELHLHAKLLLCGELT